MRQTVIHLMQRMDDEIDGRPERPGDRQLAVEPLLGLGPILDAVGQALVIDGDQEIEVGLVALAVCGSSTHPPRA